MSGYIYSDVLYSYEYTSDNGAYHLTQFVNDAPDIYTYTQYSHSEYGNRYVTYTNYYNNLYNGDTSSMYKSNTQYAYQSYVSYNPSYGGYSLSKQYQGPEYSGNSYKFYADGATGDSDSKYEYNSGRLQGYVFVTYINSVDYQADAGSYVKSTYYAGDEGYYSAQHGVQGDFGSSTYYYNTAYIPV